LVLVVDYGSQYSRLITRRIRENEVYSEVVFPDDKVDLSKVDAVILSGGPRSVYEEDAPKLPEWFQEYKGPVLAICYGMQLIVKELGGEVRRGRGEYGRTLVELSRDPIFEGIPEKVHVWMSHGDEVVRLPEGFHPIAVSETGVIAAATDGKRFWLLQFHPEVHHTEYGDRMISNFLFNVCKLEKNWKIGDLVEEKIRHIKETIGNKKAILALSGGVDSSVAAVLVHRAIGKNLVCVFVDHGLLRKNEREEVERVFKEHFDMNLVVVDARKRFLEKLRGVTDPEKKRKIIGEEFIRVFEEEAKKHDVEFLVQGTIYSDVIESAASGKTTAKIKSHHNVGGLPEKMNLKLVEPLRDLFKDEVRKVGTYLGIPDRIINRHPFPGPGLAVRVLGEVTEEKLEILREADYIFIETLRKHDYYDKVWQAFAVLLPIKSVGVKGDARAYEYVVALRAVNSVEGMTADWSRIPHDILDEAARRITREVKGVGRVVYDITSKPPATIEWE